ncbi:MAG: hypothetical protein QXD05_00025 [Candidatus Pacearchaeota archaeon]
MDYSNTKLSGYDLLNKNARQKAILFKLNYIKKNIKEIRLFDTDGRHERFINDAENIIMKNVELTDAQIKYIEFLYNKLGG